MDIFENKVILPILSALLGSVLTIIVNKILNKTKTIFYTVNTERVAFSSDDYIFGNVQVVWQGHNVNNLFNTVIEIENTTSVDYKDIEFKIWSGQNLLILNEKTSILNTTRIIQYTKEYQEKIAVVDGETPTPEQLDLYHHEREYKIDVFNRGQKLHFTYLSTLINDEENHFLWIELIYPGLRFKQRFATNKIHNVLVTDALFWGLIVSVATVILSVLYIANPWIIASLCLFVGALAQSFGAYVYKTLSYTRNLIIK